MTFAPRLFNQLLAVVGFLTFQGLAGVILSYDTFLQVNALLEGRRCLRRNT